MMIMRRTASPSLAVSVMAPSMLILVQGLEFTKSLYNGHHQKSSPGHRDLHSGSGSSLELGRSEVLFGDIQQPSSLNDPI
jgi:hypothetical protein